MTSNPSSNIQSDEPLFAVIDLGTNTFHLLVGYWEQGRLIEVHRERHYVRVAADGIATIGDAPYQRALAAAASLGTALKAHTVQQAAAYGTAALRTASNGPQLRAAISELLGVDVQIIDGHREASLIAKGVLAAGLEPSGNQLLMDIGGGSTEFIVVKDGVVGFSESYPLGAQVLRQAFHTTEPFVREDSPSGKTQHDVLYAHLSTMLAPVLAALEAPFTLVGASGTFDVLGDLYGTPVTTALKSVPAEQVRQLYSESVSMTLEVRTADERIPSERADMIVVALALVDFILDKYPDTQLLTCDYALKEGALIEMQAAG